MLTGKASNGSRVLPSLLCIEDAVYNGSKPQSKLATQMSYLIAGDKDCHWNQNSHFILLSLQLFAIFMSNESN